MELELHSETGDSSFAQAARLRLGAVTGSHMFKNGAAEGLGCIWGSVSVALSGVPLVFVTLGCTGLGHQELSLSLVDFEFRAFGSPGHVGLNAKTCPRQRRTKL